MKRVNLDRAPPAVKQFVSTLPLESEGVELELNGRALCRVLPPGQLSEAEKKALIDERWRLIRQARERNRGVPARVIEREVQEAVEQVRRRRRS
jgi:hypothetical protein